MHARAFAATAHDLAAFHTERAATYRVLAEILGAPPTPRALEALHEMLSEAKLAHNPPLQRLAEDVDRGGDKVLGPERTPLDTHCLDPEDRVRGEAFRAAGRTEDCEARSDLLVLSHLAEQSARAIRQGDFARAAELSHLQYRFFDEHGVTCLDRLAAELTSSGFAPYVAVGRLLRKMVSDDRALLDADPRDALCAVR
jgi:TorA maturation chaperone TorD